MKHTKLIAWILAAVLCSGTVLAGCGKSEETEDSGTAEGTVVMEEEMQEIGDPNASLEILLTNEMGGVITELSVKSPSETEYPDNMMTTDQTIEDGETITLFYEPVTEADFQSAEDEEENTDSDSEEDPVTESTYSLQVTMENGDVYELSDFDVEDMEEVTLYLEDDVAYIEYMSISQNVLINTKEREQEIKADKDAAQVVIDMIAAIGTVTAENAKEHRDEIEAAREAYDALTDAQKAYVTNVDLLEDMESLLGIRSNAKKATEASNGNAYNEGYYCGDNGYTKEDAEARAAELGYTSGSKAYQDFWNGYNYALNNRDGGDDYAIGYRLGQQGYSEEEARAEYTRDGSNYDPKSDHVKLFWEGYYDGYAEYEALQADVEEIYYSDAYQTGLFHGELGHSLDEAEAGLREYFGPNSYSPYYQSFLDGYYDGLAIYEDENAQAEQEPEEAGQDEEEPEQDEDLPEGEPVYY